jgi:hypothetical protein
VQTESGGALGLVMHNAQNSEDHEMAAQAEGLRERRSVQVRLLMGIT